MQHRLKTFCAADSGAVTVDWMVLTAVTVSMGIAAVGSVRYGAGSLASNIDHTLDTAGVAMICQDASPYALMYMTGDQASTEDHVQGYFASISDEELLQNYSDAARKAAEIYQSGDSNYTEALDVAYLASQELARRDLIPAEEAQSFSDLNASINGASNAGCTGSGSSSGGHAMLVMDDEKSASITEEFSHIDPRDLQELVSRFKDEYGQSADRRDEGGMREALDYLYLTYQALLNDGRNEDGIAVAQETYEKLLEDYNTNYA